MYFCVRIKYTPPLAKSRLPKAGFCLGGGGSAVRYKPIAGHVVPDRMSERNSFSIENGRCIDAATLEFVDECLVVIGSHRGPASALHLGVENGSCYGKRRSRVLIGNLHVCEAPLAYAAPPINGGAQMHNLECF